MMGFGSATFGNGGSSSSFSNLSPLAPPFTLDRSVTKPICSPLVDMTEPSFGVPMNSSLHNWLPPSSQTSGLDFFANPSSEFDWVSFSNGSSYPGSQAIEPSDNHVPLLGPFSISATDASLYGDSSDSLTNSIGKAKPYYPSYASTSGNKGCPLVIVDQPSYDLFSNSHVAAFDVPSCKNYSHGSSGSERSVEEVSYSIDMLGLNKCNEFVGKQPDEELLLERTPNIVPVENSRISNIDAYSAFPGCHPKTKTPSLNLATSSQNSQFLKNAPYQEILREQDARLGENTSIFNSPATFSNRPPVVSADSFAWNIGSFKNSDYGNDLAEEKLGVNNLSILKEILPPSSESNVYLGSDNQGTCIDKSDPIITEPLSTKVKDLSNNICAAKDTSDNILKAEVRHHIPDLSSHLTLDLKTMEPATAVESYSESFDQYNIAVDSPCWRGAPVSRISAFEASEIFIPHHVKKVETYSSVNLSLPEVSRYPAEDTVKVFVHEPNGSVIDNNLEKGAASSPKMSSVASALPAEEKTSDSVKAGDFYSKLGCLCPASENINEPVEDYNNSSPSHCVQQNNKKNLMFGANIASMSCVEKHEGAILNGGDSSEDGLNNLSCGAAEISQNLPSFAEDRYSKVTKAYHGESISKIDVHILVDTMHNLSELLLAYCLNGPGTLHQEDVKSLQSMKSNLDMCIINSGLQDSLFPKQRTLENLGRLHQLHKDVSVSKSQRTKIEGANVGNLLYDLNVIEKKNQHVSSVKEDNRAIDSFDNRNTIDLTAEDNMTLVSALKKVLIENFDDEEGEHSGSILYKNLWLEAEAALCAFSSRARFSRAKLEMEKQATPKVRENDKNQDEQRLYGVSSGPSTIEKSAPEAKVGPAPFSSAQTSAAISVNSHADDVITRFHILKCRDDGIKHRTDENSELLCTKVCVEQDMVEKSTLHDQSTGVPDIKDMDAPFLSSSKFMENDFGAAAAPASLSLTRSSHTDDVMSRYQILKSRDEFMNSLDLAKVQEISDSNGGKVDTLAPKIDAIGSPGIIISSMKYPPNANNKNEVDNLDALGTARQNAFRSCGNNVCSTPAGGQLEESTPQYSASKKDHWPIDENVVKGGVFGVEMEPFMQLGTGMGEKDNTTRRERKGYIEGKFPAGCIESSSSDWEHVLWGE